MAQPSSAPRKEPRDVGAAQPHRIIDCHPDEVPKKTAKPAPRPLRVIHAPNDVGGNAYHLARGERRNGFDSRNYVYTKQVFGYPADYCLKLKQYANPARSLRWWFLMLRIAVKVDVLHFNFGTSFLTYFPERWVYPDLPAWKSMGIATFITFQGCDSRISRFVMRDMDVKICENCRSRKDLCEPAYDDFRIEVINEASRYFDGIFALNPDLMRHIPKAQFLPYANCDLDDWRPPADYDWNHEGPVRVLHAPTWRELKGTDDVIAAVDALKEAGENIELTLVEGVPHGEVRKLYESADVFVDQLLAGWYGGVAVELMALGKPVVAYIREEDLQYIPEGMRDEIPIVRADKDSLQSVLRDLIRDVEERKRIGVQSRAFVEKWHHPDVVAEMTTTAYREALERRPPVRGAFKRLRTLRFRFAPTFGLLLRIWWNGSLLQYVTRRVTGIFRRKPA